LRGRFGTAKNGTYVPDVLPFDDDFWYVIGLFLAEGHIGRDGLRTRICWSFNRTGEEDLAEAVRVFWAGYGVKADVRLLATTCQVSISSRILGAWLEHVLGVGVGAYDHRVPNQIWSSSDQSQRALLRGLWDGDGSWSFVNRGPSVVLEYGTVSRELADGIVERASRPHVAGNERSVAGASVRSSQSMGAHPRVLAQQPGVPVLDDGGQFADLSRASTINGGS